MAGQGLEREFIIVEDFVESEEGVAKAAKKRAKGTRLQDLSGKWKITEMPDLTEDYLAESKDPHMILTFRRKNVRGHFEYGLESTSPLARILIEHPVN